MKKILLITIGLIAVITVGAQNGTSGNSAAISGSTNTEPTINGKPYSQYKAEQDALKRQKPTQQTPVAQGDPTSNKASLPVRQTQTTIPNEGLATGTGEMVPVKAKEPAPEKIQATITKTESKQPATTAGTPVDLTSVRGVTNMPTAAQKDVESEKPATRTSAEIEKAKQQSEQQDKVKAPAREVTTASTSSQSMAPVPPPVATEEKSQANGNSKNAGTEKQAPVVAPKKN